MKKRMLNFVLALALVIALVPMLAGTASAAEYSGSCGRNLTWTLNTNTGLLHITGTGAMNDYSKNGGPWKAYNDQITAIQMDPGITYIGLGAFARTQVITVVIPEGTAAIGQHAFYLCEQLTRVTFPSTLTEISDYAFSGCTSLTKADLPAGLTMLGEYAFHKCQLTSATIPGGVKSIGDNAFSDNGKLTTVTIQSGVKTIGNYAFADSGLTKVVLQDGLTTINDSAFAHTKLVEVVLPDSVTSIGTWAFYEVETLTRLKTGDGLKEIGRYCFEGCTNLTDVIVGDSLSVIGDYAFIDCSSLKGLNLPSTIREIGVDVFKRCNSMKYLVIPSWSCDMESGGVVGTTTIYGYENSSAHLYAVENGFAFDTLDAAPPATPFVDVEAGRFYVNAVLWAVADDITSGMDDFHFLPGDTCTRGQVVTFLWRAEGCPEPKSTTNPFTDVVAGKFYYKAVLWAYENGITAGTTPTTFEPNSKVTRGQFVTFLWRAQNKPASSGVNHFTDVQLGKFYCDAILWAAENGVTSGMTATTFEPESTCNRGQVVTFLYRCYGK